MKLSRLLSVLLLCLVAATAQASITWATCDPDGDGAINCTGAWGAWGGNYDSLNITGDQFWGPGHMVGDVKTDGALDPTIGLFNTVNNDTAFAWTSYQVNIYMNNSFTLFGPGLTAPPGWSHTVAMYDTPGLYTVILNGQPDTYTDKATIVFSGATPLAIGGTIDFSYDLSFAGSTDYGFTQEMIPVPEPATMGLLGLGLVGLLARRRK